MSDVTGTAGTPSDAAERARSAVRDAAAAVGLSNGAIPDRPGAVAGRLSFRARSWLAPDRVRLSVDGTAAQFAVDNVWEYDRFREYGAGPDGEVLADFVERLRASDVVWDVGANVGVYACFAAGVVDGGSEAVVAVEPIGRNVDRIAANLSMNDRRGTVYRLALGDETGTVTIGTNGPDAVGVFGSMVADDRSDDVEAPLTTGRRLIDERGAAPPSVLKVDVQGAEVAVLDGMADLLADCRLVYCNVYEKHFDSPEDAGAVEERLADAGFAVERIASWSGGYFVRAGGGE